MSPPTKLIGLSTLRAQISAAVLGMRHPIADFAYKQRRRVIAQTQTGSVLDRELTVRR